MAEMVLNLIYAVANHSLVHEVVIIMFYIKNVDDTWYELNDTNISKIESVNVITKNAYCLFYQKKK